MDLKTYSDKWVYIFIAFCRLFHVPSNINPKMTNCRPRCNIMFNQALFDFIIIQQHGTFNRDKLSKVVD